MSQPVVARIGARPCDLALLFALVALAMGRRFERASFGWIACVLALGVTVPFAPMLGLAVKQLLTLVYVGALYALGRELGRSDVGTRAQSAFVLGAVLCGLAGIIGVLSDLLFDDALSFARRYPFIVTSPRATGPTESPTMLGTVVSCGLVVLASLARARAVPRARGAVAASVMLIALVLTQGRSLLDLAAASAFVFAASSRGEARALGFGVAAISLCVWALTLIYRFAPLEATWPFIDMHPSLYAMCHDIAHRAFVDHPLTGVGLEGFHAQWNTYFDASRYAPHLEGLTDAIGPLDPHSTYLGYLAEAGLPAAFAFALFFASSRELARAHAPEVLVLIAFTVLAAFHMDVLTNRAIAIAIGLLAGDCARRAARAAQVAQAALGDADVAA